MATIRNDLQGTAHVINEIGEHIALTAGQTVPSNFWVGGHLIEGGHPDDQTPPWAEPVGASIAWDDITGKPAVIAAGADPETARDAIDALAVNGKAVSAAEADQLATAREIAVTGAVTGTGTFDGSANVTITTEAGA